MGLKNTPILCTIIHPLYTMSLQRVPMQHAPRWITVLPPRPTITMSHICTTTTCCATTSKSTEPTREQQPTRISGEWDGVAITFNSRGEASELPHNVVPDAFREWGVTLVAWQTQCSMMHCEDDTTVQYTLRRLYPTVGCEADAVAFEEQSHALHANEVVWVEATNGSYCLAPRHLSPKQPFTVEMCLPLNSSDDGVPWRRVRCIVQLVHRDMDDAYWPRTVEVIQERFDRPLDGRQELGGCGGGLPSFVQEPIPTLEQVQAAGWQAADPQQGPACCSSVVGGDRVMLLPGGHWCMVRDGAEGVRVEAGVVSGTKTRVVGTVVYDDQGELQYTFIGQDVLLT